MHWGLSHTTVCVFTHGRAHRHAQSIEDRGVLFVMYEGSILARVTPMLQYNLDQIGGSPYQPMRLEPCLQLFLMMELTLAARISRDQYLKEAGIFVRHGETTVKIKVALLRGWHGGQRGTSSKNTIFSWETPRQ